MGNTLTLDKDILKTILKYDDDTGIFYWQINTNHIREGDIAGHLTKDTGYIVIGFKKKHYGAHRLAWLYYYGYLPKYIDHINGIRHDNRICNLRESSSSENNQNISKFKKQNKCKLLGVRKVNNKYRSVLTLNFKKIHIGYFDTPEEAHAAYLEKKRELHKFCTI